MCNTTIVPGGRVDWKYAGSALCFDNYAAMVRKYRNCVPHRCCLHNCSHHCTQHFQGRTVHWHIQTVTMYIHLNLKRTQYTYSGFTRFQKHILKQVHSFPSLLTYFVNYSTGVGWVFTANAGRVGSTEAVLLIDRARVSPANGSSTPPHPSALVDEHGIGGWAVSDENCLERTGYGLRVKRWM